MQQGEEEDIPSKTIELLIKALAKDARSADVKRLYEFRSSLLLLDLQDESSITLKRLLLRCVMNPLFLRLSEGKKFLVYLFGIHLPFIEQLHLTIKAQMPICPKSILEVYGEIYFRAWKVAQGPYLLKIEYNCFQDLMSQAIHIANVTVTTALTKVLEYLHSQKKQRGVDEMLERLYEPILWRALKVANAKVRRNAAVLLFDAFPLNRPDSSKREMDQLLQQQFDQMNELLYDPVPFVRSVAAKGVCRVLGVYWELIPTATVNVLLSALIKDLARDKSSSLVRASVFEGLRYLLDNHLSQPSLKAMLPQLSGLVHDHSDRVRASFVDLLCEIKKSRIIRFYDIVPVEHLLARMATDSTSLSKRLTDLLLSSYFPVKHDKAVQVERCILMLKANREAAFVFYEHIHNFVPVTPLCKFVALLCKVTLKSQSLQTEDGMETDDEEQLRMDMLHIMAIVWGTIVKPLAKKENSSALQYMQSKFNDKTFEKLCAAFPSEQGRHWVLSMAAHIPREVIPRFSAECVRKLQKLNGRDEPEQYEPLLACLFAWKQGKQVLSLILKCIASGLGSANNDGDSEEGERNSKKKKSKGKREPKNKKRKRDQGEKTTQREDDSLSQDGPLIGIELLNAVLERDSSREDVFSHKEVLRDVVDNLEAYFVHLCGRTLDADPSVRGYDESSNAENEGLLLITLSSLTKIIIHFLARGGDWQERGEEILTSVLAWTGQSVLPFLSPDEEIKDEAVLEAITENIAIGASEAVVLGLCPSSLLPSIVDLFKELLSLQHREGFVQTVALPLVSRVVYQLYHEGGEEGLSEGLLLHALNVLSASSWTNLKSLLCELFTLHNHRSSLALFLSPLVKELLFERLKIPSTFPCGLSESVADLPGGAQGLASLLIGSICTSSPAMSALTECLDRIVGSTIEEQQTLQAFWKMLDIISVAFHEVSKTSRTIDLSPLQNCLMNVVTKSRSGQELDMLDDSDLTEGAIFSAATSLLRDMENREKRASAASE